jgi:O-antigen/teichoic acid export membrane protein
MLQNIMSWIFAQWRPKFEFNYKIALEMFHFGKFIFLGAFFWFLRMNLDNLLVGKLLGVKALGLYAIAFNIANFTSDYFGSKVQRVVFPAYSKMEGNLYDLRSAALKVLKHVSLIALPLGVVIFLLSQDFLRIFYGSQWIEASSVLRILVLAGIFNTLPTGMNAIFLACDKPRWGFWITTLQVAIFLLFITPAAKFFGMNGVGAIVSLASMVAFFITIVLAIKLLYLKMSQIYLSIRSALIISFLIGAVLVLAKNLLMLNLYNNHFQLNFVILSFLALIIYFISMFRIERKIFDEAKGVILNLKS